MQDFLDRMAAQPSVVLYVPVIDETTGVIAEYTPLPITVSDKSYRHKAIMGENILNLQFILPGYMIIPLGTYCEFMGEVYTLETLEDIKKNGERNFEYDLILQSDQYKLSKYILRNIVPGDSRLKFSYTARPQEFLRLLVDNLNTKDEGWSYGSEYVDAYEQTVSFNMTNCAEALKMIAEAFETEWEVKGKTIYLRKIEYNKDNPLPLSFGKDNGLLPGVGRQEYSEAQPVSRLFVQGGDRNIDASKYRRTEATGQVGSRELLMPAEIQIKYDGAHFNDEEGFDASSPNVRSYITDSDGASLMRYENKDKKGLLEGSLDCSGIYPMREGVVASVVTVDQEQNFYDFIDDDSGIPDYANYIIEGETMTVIFQSGMLAGKEFDVNYKHPGRFEIVPQTIDGIIMPGGAYMPNKGDKYSIFHVMLPDEYIAEAEKNMLKQAVKYLYDNEQPRFTISATLDAAWAKRNWTNIGGKLIQGGFIRYSDNQFLPDGLDIRITDIKQYVNNPHKPEIEMSNNAKSGAWVYNTKRKVESEEVTITTKDVEVMRFAKRGFREVGETMTMLQNAMLGYSEGINPITVNTMQLIAGDSSLQYEYSQPRDSFAFNPETKQFIALAGTLTHKTMGINAISASLPKEFPYHWEMSAYTSAVLEDGKQTYYLYATVPNVDGGGNGSFRLESEPKPFNEGNNINLLVGILNSESNGDRSFASLYGFSEILPGRITTGLIVSEDGENFLDLENNKVKIGNESSSVDWNVTKSNVLTIKGDVESENAEISGQLTVRDGIFYGSISTPPTIIDENNFDEYFANVGDDNYVFRLTKDTGFNFSIQYMPNKYASLGFPDGDEYIGITANIFNDLDQSLQITGFSNNDGLNQGITAFMKAHTFAKFVCVKRHNSTLVPYRWILLIGNMEGIG